MFTPLGRKRAVAAVAFALSFSSIAACGGDTDTVQVARESVPQPPTWGFDASVFADLELGVDREKVSRYLGDPFYERLHSYLTETLLPGVFGAAMYNVDNLSDDEIEAAQLLFVDREFVWTMRGEARKDVQAAFDVPAAERPTSDVEAVANVQALFGFAEVPGSLELPTDGTPVVEKFAVTRYSVSDSGHRSSENQSALVAVEVQAVHNLVDDGRPVQVPYQRTLTFGIQEDHDMAFHGVYSWEGESTAGSSDAAVEGIASN